MDRSGFTSMLHPFVLAHEAGFKNACTTPLVPFRQGWHKQRQVRPEQAAQDQRPMCRQPTMESVAAAGVRGFVKATRYRGSIRRRPLLIVVSRQGDAESAARRLLD